MPSSAIGVGRVDPGHRVGAGRFSCGWPLDHVVKALLTSKREDLTILLTQKSAGKAPLPEWGLLLPGLR